MESWDDAWTWELLRAAVIGRAGDGGAARAANAFLALGDFALTDKGQRQRAALDAMGSTISTDSVRVYYDGNNQAQVNSRSVLAARDFVLELAESILGTVDLEEYAERVLSAKAIQPDDLDEHVTVARAALTRLESMPTRLANYPAHLTTSVLASQLNYFVPTPPAPVPADRIPVLPSPAERYQVSDLVSAIEAPKARLILTGGPGRGKSTFLRALAIQRIGRADRHAVVVVSLPVLTAQCAELDRVLEISDILRLASEQHNSTLGFNPLDLVENSAVLSDLALLLDGYDEVPDGLRSLANDILATLDSFSGSALVTARKKPNSRAVGGWSHLEVGSFWEGREFLEMWFQDHSDPGYHRAIDTLNDPVYKDIADSPLLLGFVAQVSELQQDFDSVSDLYDQYISLALERSWKGAGLAAYDDAVIHRLKKVARELAWKMARGEIGGKARSTGWEGSARLKDLLDAMPAETHNDVQMLVRLEALFYQTNIAAARLHTEYAWTHRTIQEHLSGVYLRESIQSGGPASFEIITDFVDGDEDWTVALSHTFSEMSDEQLLLLYKALIRPEARGLDRQILLQMRTQVIDSSSPDSELRRFAVEIAQDPEDLAAVYEYAPDVVGDRLVDLLGREDLGELGAVNLLGPIREMSREMVERARRILRSRNNRLPFVEAGFVLIQSEHEPVAAAFEYLEMLRTDTAPFPLPGWGAMIENEDDAFEILRRVRELEWPHPRWMAVMMVGEAVSAEMARTVISADELDVSAVMGWLLAHDREYRSGALAEGLSQVVDDPLGVLASVLAGAHGPYLALSAAQSLTYKDLVANPSLRKDWTFWAMVEFYAQLIEVDRFPAVADEPFDRDRELRVVADFTKASLEDAEHLYGFMLAVNRLKSHADPELVPVLLQCYLRLQGDATPGSSTFAPRFTLERMTEMVGAHLGQSNFESVLDYLEDRETDLDLDSEVVFPLLRAMWRYGSKWVSPERRAEAERNKVEPTWLAQGERFERLVNWGTPLGLPVLEIITSDYSFSELRLLNLLGVADPRALQIERNLSRLDEIFGYKDPYIWREQKKRLIEEANGRMGANKSE